jgi:hypothetical protein
MGTRTAPSTSSPKQINRQPLWRFHFLGLELDPTCGRKVHIDFGFIDGAVRMQLEVSSGVSTRNRVGLNTMVCTWIGSHGRRDGISWSSSYRGGRWMDVTPVPRSLYFVCNSDRSRC